MGQVWSARLRRIMPLVQLSQIRINTRRLQMQSAVEGQRLQRDGCLQPKLLSILPNMTRSSPAGWHVMQEWLQEGQNRSLTNIVLKFRRYHLGLLLASSKGCHCVTVKTPTSQLRCMHQRTPILVLLVSSSCLARNSRITIYWT